MSHRWTLRRVRRLYSRFSARWVVVEDLRPGPMAIRTTMRRARFVHADPAILLTARLPRTRAATSSRVAEVLLEGTRYRASRSVSQARHSRRGTVTPTPRSLLHPESVGERPPDGFGPLPRRG
jgi:hypothetical protein